MAIETRTFYSSKYNKKFVYKKTSENKRVLYEIAKPMPAWDDNPADPKFQKEKMFKVQEKEYGEYWIKRKTNRNINPYEMPLKRFSQVPRMNKIEPYQGASFTIKESGGFMQADFLMQGSVDKKGNVVGVDKMRNGFVEHIWWDKNDVRKSKIKSKVFDVDEVNCREISNLAKCYLKKLGKTFLTMVK